MHCIRIMSHNHSVMQIRLFSLYTTNKSVHKKRKWVTFAPLPNTHAQSLRTGNAMVVCRPSTHDVHHTPPAMQSVIALVSLQSGRCMSTSAPMWQHFALCLTICVYVESKELRIGHMFSVCLHAGVRIVCCKASTHRELMPLKFLEVPSASQIALEVSVYTDSEQARIESSICEAWKCHTLGASDRIDCRTKAQQMQQFSGLGFLLQQPMDSLACPLSLAHGAADI